MSSSFQMWSATPAAIAARGDLGCALYLSIDGRGVTASTQWVSACVALAIGLAGCSSESASPKAADAVLLHASDVPDMRLEGASLSGVRPSP
jgi:hypothetical protein